MSTISVELFGNDPKIQRAIQNARNVAVTKASVLISGETGIGKRSLAQFIHNLSTRAAAGLTVVDCSQDVKTVENEILGFREPETGRFVKGALESANGGTVVFANIDGLQEDFQKRLHKILNELEDYDIDVRVIATTCKNLSKLVGSGRFYRGLYTHLSANSIHLNPLRERESDLIYITESIINTLSQVSGKAVELDQSAKNKILSHYWTHNVHELKAVIESSVTELEGNILREQDVQIGEKKSISMINEEDNEGIRLMSLKDAEKLLIKKALIHTSENRTQAAKILGVSIRTLRNKINEYRNDGNAYFVNLR
ncbi:MAG: sigma-54-dependent transcriptional regulator [Bacteriovoracaceae bacterium]